jgi:WS/DGAT/MGAT family acyltransferase
MDATFLHLESSNTPMHIGCILTFSSPLSGKMTFQRFKHYVQSRLPISPVFRQKLSLMPLNIDRAYWVDDQDFDINNHVKHYDIASIGRGTQKTAIVDRFFSQKLDPAYPLWEMLYLDNAAENAAGQPGEFTVLMKFHHAALDGKAAEAVLSGLLTGSSDQAEILFDQWSPKRPSVVVMVGNKLRSLYQSPKAIAVFAKHVGKAVQRSRNLRKRDAQQSTPPHFFTSPNTAFNNGIKPTRSLRGAHLSLPMIKAIKSTFPGYTVNDVVLAVCSGALKRHLDQTNAHPDSPLVAMAPVSKRVAGTDQQGNAISAMLVSLATDVQSPAERLHRIHANAQQSKEYNREVEMEQVITHLPSWSSSLVLKTYTRLKLGKFLKPVFNLIITNVPGSPTPLFLDGAKLKSIEGLAPIVDGMGLTMVVTSYIDTLTIAVTSTAEMAAAAPDFINYLHASLQELNEAVLGDTTNKRNVSGF